MKTTPICDLLGDTAARLRADVGASSSDFDLNPGVVLPEPRRLRPAGVLVLVSDFDGPPSVILTKRASGLKHHPGQIAFPGGKKDPGDPTIAATALREAGEEIGLPEGHAEVVAMLPQHETVTGFLVSPVIARLTRRFDLRPQPGEVEEVFSVPLAHLLDPACFLIESRRWRGQNRSYYVIPYGPYYIWGATARILRFWADLMTR